MTNSQTLAMTGIAKRFGPTLALDDVTLSVDHGEAVALLGENGAGKSTLLRVMTGELQPDSGTVTVHGVPTRLANPAHARALGVAVVHQEPEIFDSMSVAENLLLPHLGGRGLRSIGVRRSSLATRARRLLTEVGFGAELDPRQSAGELTPGLRQVVEIARALATRPRVLALDEPTASLSERETDRLFDLVERLRADGVGVVYVTHRLREVERLCDRVVVLRDGRVVASRPRRGTDQGEMVRLMVGRERLTIHRRGAPGDTPIRLAIRGLSTERVDGVSLTVGAGEVVGVGGLVGSGRSAIARAVTGLDPIIGGEIAMDGVPIRIRGIRDALANGICLIPEDRKKQGLVNDRNIRENISLTASGLCSRHGWIDPKAERNLARKWVDELDIRASGTGQSVSTLSGGNQQKVVLARALAGAPKVLVLDEPTKGVDVGARAEIYRIIDELAQDGMSVLFVSSELPELLAVSDRIVMVAGGRIAGQIPGPEASEETLLAMVLRNATAETPAAQAGVKGVG